VAAGIDADDENNGVENINHFAQPKPERGFGMVTPYLLLLCLHLLESRSSGDEELAWEPA
jgi:hypothetical protein